MSSSSSPSPTKKKQAFKSYLQGGKDSMDQQQGFDQQYTQQNSNCTVCGAEVPDGISKKKKCGFCDQITCNQHLRKRRNKKKKLQKICDNCEDKYLYEFYMKLQIKAQQSLSAQQQILEMKRNDTNQILQSKQTKRRQLSFDQQQIQRKYDQQMLKFLHDDQKLKILYQKMEIDFNTCLQIQQYNVRMSNKIKFNYQEDFRILSIENQKLGEELSLIEKRCFQVRLAMEKRQKELEQAYQSWERKQFGKGQQSETIPSATEQKCIIF